MTVFTPYDVENALVQGYDVVVNKAKVAAYRAPGAPQAEYACEAALNELAAKLDLDPIEFRQKNAAKEGTVALYGPKFGAIGMEECLRVAKESDHWNSPLGENQGRGLACGFWFNIGGTSTVIINMNTDGTANLIEGSPDIGGSRASMALMAAEVLGIEAERIKPIIGDTEAVGFSATTGGSRTTFATGMATIEAARDVVVQVKERCASIWNVTPDQVEYEDGVATNTAGDDKMTLAEVCAHCRCD